MLRPKRKCICKKCEDCNFNLPWKMSNDKGEERFEDKCGFFVLFEEISRIRGAVDGLQSGVNDARNRALETRGRIEDLGMAVAKAFDKQQKLLKPGD